MTGFKKATSLYIMMLLTSIFSASNGLAQTSTLIDNSSIYESAMELINLTVDKARSEEYLKIYTTHPAILNTIKEFADGNYETPEHIYSIELSEGKVCEFLSQHELINSFDTFPNNIRQEIINKFITGIPSLLEGQAGVDNLAASTFLTTQQIAVNKELSQSTLLIYTFSEGTPIAVLYFIGKDNAVLTVAQPLLGYDLEQLKTILPISESNKITLPLP
ncbi:MAG: hypothetical protein K2J63_02505 [Muribaculaceae bacterium]|nr:hypothetical protein [Muribaculaceae bacterium]